jgi:small subunit ribosomal protein S20
MPNRKSAAKSLKNSFKKYKRNKPIRSELKTRDKKFNTLLSQNKLDEAKNYLTGLIAKLDKAVSGGIIHKNKADRKKSRLMKKLNKFSSQRT